MSVNRWVSQLPAAVPFVAPEVLERRRGSSFELRMGANESAFGPSPRALEAARLALDSASLYGDPESHDLRVALSRSVGADAEAIVVGSGIDDLLLLAVRAILDPGDTVVASLGTYPTFAYHVRACGGSVIAVPYAADFSVDLDALAERAAEAGARIVYLANPDNPSGTHHPTAAVAALAERLPAGCTLLLDEAYSDFVEEAGAASSGARVLRFRTFSKGHGLAGLRIGYALAGGAYIDALQRIRTQFGVNRVAQAAALASLEDVEHLRSVVERVAAERPYYAAIAAEHGWRAIPSATNFVAWDTGDAGTAAAMVAALDARRVFIRRGGAPPLDRCLRVTIGTPAQRERFGAALAEVIDAAGAGASERKTTT